MWQMEMAKVGNLWMRIEISGGSKIDHISDMTRVMRWLKKSMVQNIANVIASVHLELAQHMKPMCSSPNKHEIQSLGLNMWCILEVAWWYCTTTCAPA